MKNLKKIIAMALIATTLTAAAPKKAEAAVGGLITLFGGPVGVPVMIVGGAVLATTAAATAISANTCDDWGCLGAVAIVLVGGALGIVILDGEQQQTITFNAVDSANGAKMGMNESERVAYNSELEEINAVRDQIGAELSATKKPTIEKSNALWTKYSAALSPEAFAGVKKVSQAFVNSL